MESRPETPPLTEAWLAYALRTALLFYDVRIPPVTARAVAHRILAMGHET